ncbi:hypothetical protein GQ457_16G019360 [Hibiscus cannabinus]
MFKERLVAQGLSQSYGIDYQKTFALVAKLNTVRVLLSLVVNKEWILHQLEIKNAFLNGTLEEKFLYFLKQSPRAWFNRFTRVNLNNGYRQCQTNHTLFTKVTSTRRKSILIVYVDDIDITRDAIDEIESMKKLIALEFGTNYCWKIVGR